MDEIALNFVKSRYSSILQISVRSSVCVQIGAGVVGLIKQSHAEVVCMERVTGRGCHSYVCGGQLYCTLRPSVMTILCAGGLELCENLVLRDLLVWREGDEH